MFNFGSLFGGNIPNLGEVTAMPGMDMGQLGAAGPMTDMLASYTMPQQPNIPGLLSAMGGLGGQEQQPMPTMQSGPMAAQLQAGGEQLVAPYSFKPTQFQPTAQRLQGLLGGAYGSF